MVELGHRKREETNLLSLSYKTDFILKCGPCLVESGTQGDGGETHGSLCRVMEHPKKKRILETDTNQSKKWRTEI